MKMAVESPFKTVIKQIIERIEFNKVCPMVYVCVQMFRLAILVVMLVAKLTDKHTLPFDGTWSIILKCGKDASVSKDPHQMMVIKAANGRKDTCPNVPTLMEALARSTRTTTTASSQHFVFAYNAKFSSLIMD